MKSLLLRFAGAISSGESEADFLAQEAAVEREQYINRYERSLETLQKWGDAYAALLVSVTLIVVVALISTMLMDAGPSFVILLTGTMFVITVVGVYVIFRTAPQEIKTYNGRIQPRERARAASLLLILGPVGAVAFVCLAATWSLGAGVLVLGIFLIPTGYYSYKDDTRVSKIDQELPNFFRALGNVSGALGTTLSTAMGEIDRRAMGSTLEPYIRRLQSRLGTQISPEVCWDRFTAEIGSELVSRTSTMFVHGTSLGGSPERVGEISSSYAMSIALLRAKRQVTALPFSYLVIPLHGAMSGLLIFVLSIMESFSTRLSIATGELGQAQGTTSIAIPDLPIFQSQDLGLVSHIVVGTVLLLAAANSLAPKFAMGGHSLNVAFYASIMCILTGTNLLLIPPLAASILTG